jgi:hypothetical protein
MIVTWCGVCTRVQAGKTTVLVALLRALTSGSSRACGRMLVCAPSNRAVHELLERLLAALAAQRVRDEMRGTARSSKLDGEHEYGHEAAASAGEHAAYEAADNGCGAVGAGANGCKESCGAAGVYEGLCEEDVVLVGDADKVAHGSVASRVFVHRIESQWVDQLTKAAHSLRQLSHSLSVTPTAADSDGGGDGSDGSDGDGGDGDGGDGDRGDSDGGDGDGVRVDEVHARPVATRGTLAFCSRADVSQLVRISHTCRCARSQAAVRSVLHAACESVQRVHTGVLRRLPPSWSDTYADVAESVHAALLAIRSAATAFDPPHSSTAGPSMQARGGGSDRDWPCELHTRRSELTAAVDDAASAVDKAVHSLATMDGDGGAAGRALCMLSSARLVFCTLVASGSYLVRSMEPVEHLVVDEAAQASPRPAPSPTRALADVHTVAHDVHAAQTYAQQRGHTQCAAERASACASRRRALCTRAGD